MRLAVDAMGGDFAPREVVAGAVAALAHLTAADELVLIGQEERVREELKEAGDAANDPRLRLVHASQVIEMGDHPVEALRQKKDSSIAVMARLAAEGEVDAVLSAGNTGACVAACQMKMRPIKGVSRPGIAVVIPSFTGPVVLCDVGANVAPKPHHLYEYAQMSTVYFQQLLNRQDRPRVALLSIGEEQAKGNQLVKEVRDLIRADARLNFVGNVEGRTLLSGQADIVICDGFVGNVVLKLIEGLADGLIRLLVKDVSQADSSLAKHVDPILKKLWERHDYSEYGGAPLLGVDGVCIICHGASDRRAIGKAVCVAHRLASSNLNERIAEFVSSSQAVDVSRKTA